MSASVAWVTGGSGGIGRAVVLELARRGFSVGIGFLRSEDAAGRVGEEAARLGARTQLLRGDLVERNEVHRMGEELVSGLGPPDVLVCAAGVTRDALLGASEAVDFDEVLRVNFAGAVNACREASRHMVARRRGAIVLVSSVAAQRPGRGQSNYAASKGATEAFARSIAVELAPRGIRVNAVAPGVIDTAMSADLLALARDEVNRRILLRRPGTAEEVARVIAFLCGEEASYVTGQVWNVDGGFKLE
jgi:3-oxoacyl-[acyl-carrier protein] reductase